MELLTRVDKHKKIVKGECWIASMRLEKKKKRMSLISTKSFYNTLIIVS